MAESKTVTSGADDQYPRAPTASLERVQHGMHGGSQAVQQSAIGNTRYWKDYWEVGHWEYIECLMHTGFTPREDFLFKATDALMRLLDEIDELVW